MWASHCNQWALCGIVILCREGWQRSSSQITLGFFVMYSCGLWLHVIWYWKSDWCSGVIYPSANKFAVVSINCGVPKPQTYTAILEYAHLFGSYFVPCCVFASAAWWCDGYDVGLQLKRSWFWQSAILLLGSNFRQVVHTHLPLSPSSITWYRSQGSGAIWLGI